MSTPIKPDSHGTGLATASAQPTTTADAPPVEPADGGSGASLRITESRGLSYRVPQSKGASRRPPANYVVSLHAVTTDGRKLEGIGEGQPRGWRTGDAGSSSWDFLEEAVRRLEGHKLPATDPAAALAAVRQTMARIYILADEYADDVEHRRPYRGTLLGIEVALLDLTARALSCTLAQLLGQARDCAPAAPRAISARHNLVKMHQMLLNQASQFEAVRLVGEDDIAENLGLLELAATTNRRKDIGRPDRPLWIDINGRLNREQASEFVVDVVESIAQGRLPNHIIIEQPVPVTYGDHMPTLQREVDQAVAALDLDGIDVRIMGDESIWDEHSIGRMRKIGGLRGLNIRPAQAGGLLASIDLANQALRHNPGTIIFLSRMVGASELTSAALRNLALALPRIDCANAAAVVDDHLPIAEAIELEEALEASGETVGSDADESGALFGQDEPGLGMTLAFEAVLGSVSEYVTFPPPPAPTWNGMAANVYEEVGHLHPLGSNGTKGHLLEREALALGLSTSRFSKGAFMATDGVQEPLNFKWSRSPLSSAVSLALTTHKEATRMQLQRAGVPVPEGRTFANGDFAAARAFVERIGYPVVVKPAMGVRGIGVVANISNYDQLQVAFDQLTRSRLGSSDFIVEKHLHGSDYRIVVVGDEVIAAILREPASVLGNGERTVAELLIAKNMARRRNPHLWGRPAKYNDAAEHQLQRQGLELTSIPEKDQRVVLANTCSLSQGGDSIDVLDEMHPSIKEASVAATKAIPGLAFCGVDFLLEDHTKPLKDQDAGVCELNAHAAIGNCEYPLFGTPREVARTMIEACVDTFDLKTAPERLDHVALHVKIRGKVTRVGYREWLQRRARRSGVTGWVRNVDRRTVEAVLVGPTIAATAVTAATILGPRRALPTSYTTTHIDPPSLDGFQVLDEPPEGYAYMHLL